MQENMIEGFQLSPQQKHLWSLQQSDHSQSYYAQCAVLVEGNLDISQLKTAWQQVIARHEILRTYFYSLPGVTIPTQVIAESNTLAISEYDFRDQDPQAQTEAIDSLFQAAGQQPFDFQAAPLLRITLIALADDRHMMLISLPAMCADRAALENLVHEIGHFYTAIHRDEELPDEPLQYADLAQWQNDLLEAEETEIGRTYWQAQNPLQWPLPLTALVDQAPEEKNFKPESLSITLSSDEIMALKKLSQQYNIPIRSWLATCWYALLWRFTRQPDIVIGIAHDGRDYEELEGSLGLLAKYLPLHRHLADDLRFVDLLEQVNQSLQEAYEWQEAFSWSLVDDQTRGDQPAPFLAAGFDYQEWPADYSANGIIFAIQKLYACTDRFYLRLSCRHHQETVNAVFHYDASQLREEDVQRLAEQWHVLLKGAIEDEEATIGRLPILNKAQQHQLLIDFNQTATNYPQTGCIHHLIEEQVERTPDHIAVEFADQKLTYKELNRHANQLAHHLQSLGVVPETMVGVCLEPSLEMIISIVGVLKAGGAYVPLDPAYPQERLAFILEDTRARVLLSQSQLQNLLPPDHAAHVLYLDSDWDAISQQSKKNPAVTATPGNRAYAIHTSGSTGTPKGVMVSHQNLVHSSLARSLYYDRLPARFLLLSSFAFDSSIVGLFWPLCQGGTLLLPPASSLFTELAELAEFCAAEQVSHTLMLPSFYSLLLQEASPGQLDSMQAVIVAGERCPETLVPQHQQTLPHVSLFNEYGPTEGTVWSTVHNCQDHLAGTMVPIGRPIANTRMYVLDADLQPVPIGVPGELYIEGPSLSQGYLNRPALTAVRFIPNPFVSSSQPAALRLYKTGDLVRYRPNGDLEFLGRVDHQVKVRGFRVEPEEIEAVLGTHPSVTEAVVLAWAEGESEKQLVAYATSNQERPLDNTELKQFLSQKLPYYMVPALFVPLETMPQMPNGKVDRQALPSPTQAKQLLKKAYVAPRTPAESLLADLWSEVLGFEQIGINDNFFELGGDSIRSIQVRAKAQEQGLDFSVQQLFQAPTISALAAVAEPVTAESTSTASQPFSLMSEEDLMKLKKS